MGRDIEGVGTEFGQGVGLGLLGFFVLAAAGLIALQGAFQAGVGTLVGGCALHLGFEIDRYYNNSLGEGNEIHSY